MAEEIIPPKPNERWLIDLVKDWDTRYNVLDWLREISAEISPYLKVSEPDILVGVRVHRDIFGQFNFLYDWREKRILIHKVGMDKLLRRTYRGRAPYEALLREVTSFLEGFFIYFEYYVEHAKKGDEIVDEWLRETDTAYHERDSSIRAFKFADEMTKRYIKHAWRRRDWYARRVKRKIMI